MLTFIVILAENVFLQIKAFHTSKGKKIMLDRIVILKRSEIKRSVFSFNLAGFHHKDTCLLQAYAALNPCKLRTTSHLIWFL